VYNNKAELRCSLISSLQQKYNYVERIVIDGGSSDGTQDILHQYSLKLDKVISEPDKGIYDALNKGIILSSGEIIGFLHSDDFFADDDVLSKIAEQFLNPQLDFLFGDLCYVNSKNPKKIVRFWKAEAFKSSKLKKGWMPPHPTVYVRKNLFERFGLFDLQYRISSDYEWMLRVLRNDNVNVGYLPIVLVHMGTGGLSNRSLKNILIKSKEDWHIIRHYNLGGFPTLIMKNIRKIEQFWSK
jgi:glycosyltransferase